MNNPAATFTLSAADAAALAATHSVPLPQLLTILTTPSLSLSRVPISCFPVTAAGLTADGRVFVGVNLEFPGLPLHHSVHAEQFLVANISIHPPFSPLTHIVVSAYPCGHCRQFFQEIRGAPDIQIRVIDGNDEGLFRPVEYFLPHRFGPDDLLHKDVPLILEGHDNGLIIRDENKGFLLNGFSDSGREGLVVAALEAANESHAPYSGCPSGVALLDDDGKVYKGSYMESAAYNPSLGPAQAAIVAYVVNGGKGYDRIVAAVLVEKEGAAVRQYDTVRLFLKNMAPKCEFRVVRCHTK
ncbi:hypothetical protein Droror1_Dr00007313 [Drosera rotundifolia]